MVQIAECQSRDKVMAAIEPECESPVFRPRKSHTKSRNGCLSCKQQRRKCDEARPKCSRCSKRNVGCRYAAPIVQEFRGPHGDQVVIEPDLPICRAVKASTILAAGLPPALSLCDSNGTSLADTLAVTEVELLTRYLTHTSHIIPVDGIDVFALQIGIPNLAFASAPLMDSVLALAAVCRCHEILKMRKLNPAQWHEVQDLFALADHHYSSSLHKIRAASSDPTQYDNVLANATLMVLHGCANHSARIRLSRHRSNYTAESGTALFQWTYLIRAAHTAYDGLLQSYPMTGKAFSEHGDLSPPMAESDSVGTEASNPSSSMEDGPSTRTRYLTLPVILATSEKALTRVRDILEAHTFSTTQSATCSLNACFEAFEVLCDIFDTIISKSTSSSPEVEELPMAVPVASALSTVAPWLRTYVARVTSATPQKQLRRIINSFLSRVPVYFLQLAQAAIEDDISPIHVDRQACKMALNIFSHWLVLVTLLDGVWWIDGIGEWELSRAVNAFGSLPAGDEEWWPAKMLRVRQELLGG